MTPQDILERQLVYQMPGGAVRWQVVRWGSGKLWLRPLGPSPRRLADAVEWTVWKRYIEQGLVTVES